MELNKYYKMQCYYDSLERVSKAVCRHCGACKIDATGRIRYNTKCGLKRDLRNIRTALEELDKGEHHEQ